jgi:hypothetical protein
MPLERYHRLFEKFRKLVAVTGFTVGACIFWSMIPVVIARMFTDISEVHALLFIGLPTSILIGAYIWPRLPKALGFDDEL